MRTRQLFKILITILSIYILGISLISAANGYSDTTEGDNYALFNIETISYAKVTTNTENTFRTDPTKSEKVIKLGEYTTIPTSSEDYRAIPHISISNRTATLSADDSHSTTCSLLAKVTVNYKDSSIGTYTTWYEIDDLKTYIYRRTYLYEEANSFTVTLYYILDNPNNLPDTSGATAQILSLDTGGDTSFYFFYLTNNYEDPYYYGDLTENIITVANPERNSDTYLNINAERPSSWTETSFFENIGRDNLEWIVYLQAGGVGVSEDNSYRIGLKVTSKNDFTLVSTDSGQGTKEVPYSLRISKNSTEIIDFDESDSIVIENISSDSIKYFNLYTKSDYTDLFNLNAGDFSDTIYLEFISDIDDSWGTETITAIP